MTYKEKLEELIGKEVFFDKDYFLIIDGVKLGGNCPDSWFDIDENNFNCNSLDNNCLIKCWNKKYKNEKYIGKLKPKTINICEEKNNKKKRIYFAHPYKGNIINKLKVEQLIENFKLIYKSEEYDFVSPIHVYEKEYKKYSYLVGMELCFNLLATCDIIMLPNETFLDSTGCSMEYGFAKAKDIKIIWYDDLSDDFIMNQINALSFNENSNEEVKENDDFDNVDKPKHYNRGIECFDEMLMIFGKETVMNYCLCNVWKYRYRALDKNGEEDIAKSDWYMKTYKNLLEEN